MKKHPSILTVINFRGRQFILHSVIKFLLSPATFEDLGDSKYLPRSHNNGALLGDIGGDGLVREHIDAVDEQLVLDVHILAEHSGSLDSRLREVGEILAIRDRRGSDIGRERIGNRGHIECSRKANSVLLIPIASQEERI